jgi:hypothetical protein
MRDKLNSNPLAQLAVVGVLLLLVAVFMMSSGGGGSEGSEEAGAPATGSELATAAVSGGAPAPLPPAGSGVGSTPPLPHAVVASFAGNETVVLLFIRDGGIDDAMVAADVRRLSSLPGVSSFVVPAKRVADYAAIAQGVDLNRVPALVVVRPKHLDNGFAPASVQYGYQSPESVEQAVIDAGYKGHTVPYHP